MAIDTKQDVRVTLHGRVSYPSLTAQAAYDQGQHSQYPPKDVASAKPSIDLLLNETQQEKLVQTLTEFTEWANARYKDGEKRNVLNDEDTKDILKGLKDGQWSSKLYQLPIKEPKENTTDLHPETELILTIRGFAGQDFNLRAIVRDESEVLKPDFSMDGKPAKIVRLADTEFDIYAGCWVRVTVNFYAYSSQGKPGITCNATVIVFSEDDEPFGGGAGVDEDEILMDIED